VKPFRLEDHLRPELFGFMRGLEGRLLAKDDARAGRLNFERFTFWHPPQVVYPWPA
jgi:hypothetical protein